MDIKNTPEHMQWLNMDELIESLGDGRGNSPYDLNLLEQLNDKAKHLSYKFEIGEVVKHIETGVVCKIVTKYYSIGIENGEYVVYPYYITDVSGWNLANENELERI
jgi:hypothetical protein